MIMKAVEGINNISLSHCLVIIRRLCYVVRFIVSYCHVTCVKVPSLATEREKYPYTITVEKSIQKNCLMMTRQWRNEIRPTATYDQLTDRARAIIFYQKSSLKKWVIVRLLNRVRMVEQHISQKQILIGNEKNSMF